jgi:hypothetical protein
MSAAAVVAMQRRRILNKFREANATSPATAIIPSEQRVRQSMIFYKLVRDRVLVAINEERYYLDEEREAEVAKRRRTIALALLILIVIGFIVFGLTKR